MAKSETPRTYVGSLTMHLGFATARGRLVPIQKKDDEGKTKLCSPEGKAVSEFFIDEDGNKFRRGECVAAIPNDDGTFRLVDPEALEDAKDSKLPNNVVNLTVHPKADAERWLWPSKHSSYVFEPVIVENRRVVDDPQNIVSYNFIREVLSNPDYTVLSLCKIHGHQGLYKLSLYKGYVAMQRQLYPEELWQTFEQYEEAYDAKLDERTKELAALSARKLCEPFETNAYKNDVLARVKEVLSEDFDPESLKTEHREAPEIDLAAQLEAFLAS